MKSVFKILIIAMLGLSVVGCELLSPSYWNDVNKNRAERGRKCYKYPSGNVYCEDTK